MARIVAHASAWIEECNAAFASGSLIVGGIRLGMFVILSTARAVRARCPSLVPTP